jgi:polyphosphate kinase
MTVLDLQWNDNVKARLIDQEQSNPYVKRGNRKSIRSQQAIYDYLASQQLGPTIQAEL